MTNTILGYAFLKVNFGSGNRDLLDLVSPIVARALHRWGNNEITSASLQARVEDLWGMRIPAYVIQYILQRLEDKEKVIYDREKKIYLPRENSELEEEIAEKEQLARDLYNRVLSRISAALLRGDENNISPREILEHFLDKGSLALFADPDLTAAFRSRSDDLAIRIVAEITGILTDRPDEAALLDIESIVVGDFLYKAIKEISEADSFDPTHTRMDQVEVYFDAPTIFRLLGYFGVELERATREMHDLCRATGCRLRLFRHNFDEVEGGLRATAARMLKGTAYGPVDRYCFDNNLTAVDLFEHVSSLEQRISQFEIEIVDAPLPSEDSAVDWRRLEWQVDTDVRQENPESRARDVKSLEAIHTLRKGLPRAKLEQSAAILITSNRSLVRAAVRYFREFFSDQQSRNVVPVAMHDVVFSTRLWLKVPTASSSIPRNQIIAHALSNLRISEHVSQRFLEMIKRNLTSGQITSGEAAELAFSNLARNILAMETWKDDRKLDDIIFGQILSVIRDKKKLESDSLQKKISSEVEEKMNIEMIARISQIEAEMTGAVDEERKKLEQVYNELLSTKHSLIKITEDLRVARRTSKKIAAFIARILTFMFWIFIISISVLPFSTFSQAPVVIIFVVLMSMLINYMSWRGWGFPAFMLRFERGVEAVIGGILRRIE